MSSRSNNNNNTRRKKRGYSNEKTKINRKAPKRATYTQQDDVVDYLSEDDEINNQRYGCISFATITDEMKEEIQEQIADQLQKPLSDVKEIVKEWCARENPKRAVKVRGTFKSMDQTYRRAEEIRNYDANFHIFTCEVGKWLPFDPDPALLEDENYMEGQLNELLKGYKLNKQKTKMHYDQRKREMMERAILEGTPEGQQILSQNDKPIEAVKFEAEQAEDTIEQLKKRIKDLERTKEIALKTLDQRKDELEALPPAEDTKIVADAQVDNVDISESQIESLERDGVRKGIEQMRQIQEQAKQIETSEFARELSKRNPPQIKSSSDSSIQSRGEKHEVFNDDVIIPSQLRKENPE